jgi:hypothetical protein
VVAVSPQDSSHQRLGIQQQHQMASNWAHPIALQESCLAVPQSAIEYVAHYGKSLQSIAIY